MRYPTSRGPTFLNMGLQIKNMSQLSVNNFIFDGFAIINSSHQLQTPNQFMNFINISSPPSRLHQSSLTVFLHPRTSKYPFITITIQGLPKPHEVNRKINQLDWLTDYIQNTYGHHIIPFLNTDQLYDKNIEPQHLASMISIYLNDLSQNKFIYNDQTLYDFMMTPSATFNQKGTYDRLLNKANNFSRNYLSAFFTRKSTLQVDNISSYITAYEALREVAKIFLDHKKIFQLQSSEITCFEELMGTFAEMGKMACVAIEPFEQKHREIRKMIMKCDKFISQAQQAHRRWDMLSEYIRQLQAQVYKGLHEYQEELYRKNQQFRQYNQSLSKQLGELGQFIESTMQLIVKQISTANYNCLDQSLVALHQICPQSSQIIFNQYP